MVASVTRRYQLVKGDAAGHGHVVVVLHHVPVHFLVDKAEYHRLVAYKSLVVRFDVRNCFLVGASVGELPEYRGGMPVFVFFSLSVLIQ